MHVLVYLPGVHKFMTDVSLELSMLKQLCIVSPELHWKLWLTPSHDISLATLLSLVWNNREQWCDIEQW